MIDTVRPRPKHKRFHFPPWNRHVTLFFALFFASNAYLWTIDESYMVWIRYKYYGWTNDPFLLYINNWNDTLYTTTWKSSRKKVKVNWNNDTTQLDNAAIDITKCSVFYIPTFFTGYDSTILQIKSWCCNDYKISPLSTGSTTLTARRSADTTTLQLRIMDAEGKLVLRGDHVIPLGTPLKE